MNIGAIIAKLPVRDKKSLLKLRENAARQIKQDPGNVEARQIADAVELEMLRREKPVLDGWTKGTQGDPRRLMKNGVQVAVVRREETHNSTNDGVYSVEVMGEILEPLYRHVDDARAAAEEHLRIRRLKN